MSRTAIQNATDRLRVLVLDTAPGAIEVRRLTYAEADAITEVLDELHRLHLVVSDQRAQIEALTNKPPAPPTSKPRERK